MTPAATATQAERDGPPGTRPYAVGQALKRHAGGILVIVFLAAVMVLPRWWLMVTDPSEGVRAPVSFWGASHMGADEVLQAATIRDAYDGHLPVRAPHLANHRDDSLQPGAWWQEKIGILGHVLGGPFNALTVVTTVMAVAALALLYGLSFHLTGSRWAAAAALPIVMLAVQVVNVADGFLPLRHWDIARPLFTMDPDREFLAWSRFLSPAVTLAPFFAVALTLPRAVRDGSRGWMAVAVVAIAALIYSYVFYWTAMALAVAIWGGWMLARRDFDAVRRLAIVSALAVLIALPEIAIVAAKSFSSAPDGVPERVGLDDPGIKFGEAVPIAQRLIVGLPFLLPLLRRPAERGLYVALFLAPLALTAIDGIMPQPWHYRTQVWAVFAIPALIAGSTELSQWTPHRYARPASVALVAVAVAACVYLAAYQVRAIRMVQDTYAITEDEDAAFAWIRANVDDDATVVSPSITTTLLMSNLTQVSGYIMGGYNPVASDDELIDRYLRVQTAYGYDETSTFERLDPQREFPFEGYDGPESGLERDIEEHAAYYTLFWQVTRPEFIAERFPEWREQFRALQSADRVLDAYPAQYLYCGHRERFWPVSDPSAGVEVVTAFTHGEVMIYRIVADDEPGSAPFGGCLAGIPDL